MINMQSAQNFQEKNPELEPKEMLQPQEQYQQYMGEGSSSITRFLSFQYFRVLPAYSTHYQKQKLLKVNPEYKSVMISNQYLWHRFLSQGALFNIYSEIFNAEKGPFILLIILSIIIAILALFGAYYQRYLFGQLLHTHQTSGWVYFSIIVVSALMRFFIFNYVQNLANMIAMNVRCHLQNGLMRLVFHLPKNTEQGLLINNFFVSVELVTNTIKLLPYFIISFFIVFGIVGFIIDIAGVIGLVVLGLILFFLFIEVFILRYMHHLHEQYVEASDKRTSLTLFGTSTLLRLTYSGLTNAFFSLIKKYRKRETEIDRKYNSMDGVIEIMTESISFITLFFFYLSSEYSDDHSPSYKHILDAAILFSVFKTPIKMVGYGLSMCLEGYAGLHRLQALYNLCELSKPPKVEMIFPRKYPIKSCFQSELIVYPCEEELEEIDLKTDNLLKDHEGELVMIVGKVDAHPTCDEYLEKIELSLRKIAYCKISSEPLILDKSIKENILFGLDYEENKYDEILNLVNLKDKLNRFPEGDETRMDENYFKTIYLGLSFKIQVARALYSDVNLIIIDRMIFKQFQSILIKMRDYRKKRNQTTIVVNLSGSHYDISDWIIVLGPHHKEEGKYETLIKKSSILKEFQVEYLSHIDLVTEDKTSMKELMKLEEAPPEFIKANCGDFFTFYGLSHSGAAIVLIVLLLIPPLLDLYMEIIVAESVHSADETHSILGATEESTTHYLTLRFGTAVLAFIIMNTVKIIFFTLYLKISGYQIVKKVFNSFLYSKIQNTMGMSHRKSALDLQRSIEHIDTRITPDMDVGVTIIFEQLTAMIFGIISSVLFLAIGLPFFIITIVIIVVMVIYSRKLLFVRRLARSRYSSFVKKIISHRKSYMNFQRDEHFFKEFVKKNEKDIEADLNEEWLMEALGIILQIIFVILLITTIAVSLTHFEDIHKENEAFLELAISFLIGLSNGARINLKIFRSMDQQLVGISSINKIIEYHEINKTEEIREFPDNRIFTIEYKNFSIHFKDDILHDLNLSIKAGDRIVITGSRRSGKRVAFYAALGIFQSQHIRGDIELNRVPIYREKITRQSVSDKIFILQNQTLTFLGHTVAEAIKVRAPRRMTEQIDYTLNELWRVLDIEPLFTSQTAINSLSAPYLDLFALVRALMVRPQVLVLEGGLSHIDTLNRRKITEWLIKHNEISILIDLTNRIEVIKLYPRQLQFKEGVLVRDIIQH